MLLLVWFYFQLGAVGTKTITTGYDSGAGNDGGISVPWYSFSLFSLPPVICMLLLLLITAV